MEIRWLEDFIALARTRNFSRAADDRNVTQPTLSRRIKLVEEEMGVTLIDRNTLPLSLTAAGKCFSPQRNRSPVFIMMLKAAVRIFLSNRVTG
ncbi:LysR family transcriptional regulator [Aliamphritea spongicola]|nr:LysR family transcriptional regulator [Aliamphritea spongicola]